MNRYSPIPLFLLGSLLVGCGPSEAINKPGNAIETNEPEIVIDETPAGEFSKLMEAFLDQEFEVQGGDDESLIFAFGNIAIQCREIEETEGPEAASKWMVENYVGKTDEALLTAFGPEP